MFCTKIYRSFEDSFLESLSLDRESECFFILCCEARSQNTMMWLLFFQSPKYHPKQFSYSNLCHPLNHFFSSAAFVLFLARLSTGQKILSCFLFLTSLIISVCSRWCRPTTTTPTRRDSKKPTRSLASGPTTASTAFALTAMTSTTPTETVTRA